MRAAKTQANWESILTRFFAATGLPLKWDGHAKRFLGLSNHTIVRLNPRNETGSWGKMPQILRRYETELNHTGVGNVIIIVASRSYGDNVEDCIVVTRLGTLTPILKSFINNDPERNNTWHSPR